MLPYILVVIVPPVHVSTKWAFERLKLAEGPRDDVRSVVLTNDLDYWSRALVNDFEAQVCHSFPVIRECKRLLLRHGAGYASLTGTGAAVFGLFSDRASAEAAAAAAGALGFRVHTEQCET